MKDCTIFLYSRCNTCRKAKNWLEINKIAFIEKDIINETPSKDILELAISKIEKRNNLLNTSGLSYRAIGASVIKELDDIDLVKLLLKDPKLIKRPFLINKNKILLGFKINEWEDFFEMKPKNS